MHTPIVTSLFILTLLAGCKKDMAPPAAAVAVKRPADAPQPAGGPRVVPMEVTADGFVPANVSLKANEPVILRVTRRTDETCATELLIDGTDINVKLPLNAAVDVAWTPTKTGSVKFGCAMDKMVGGLLLVE
jgi:plastocyanin domain-containing protein